MNYPYKPLDKETFSERITESFPSVYLTSISIIQGVALGILAYKFFEYVKNPRGIELIVVLRSIVSFISIIIVSNEYTWLVGLFRWSPRIWDIIVPYALGFSEISPMFYLTDSKNWWFWTAVFCLVGTLAFCNTFWHCKQNMFHINYINAYEQTKKSLMSSIGATYFIFLICLIAWVLSLTKIIEILLLIFLIVCAIILIWSDEYYMKNLHKDFGQNR